ncbi:MAG: 30S ribosomal protein S4 [Candidatus Marsarchaeota archaeon]|nr:30S ribosomal protein S4 [Candidatus Marsarchaeota archaeon]
MGAPRRNRKKYNKPKEMWDLQRINADNALVEEFGLKNRRELWKVQTELSRLRKNVRYLLSGSSQQNTVIQERMIARLAKYGIANKDSTLDNLLDIDEKVFLSRRLQSVVFKKGMARTSKQARQIIVHGYIAVNGKRVTKPGYLVPVDEESTIGYYKPIDLNLGKPKEAEVAVKGKEVSEVRAKSE